MATKIKKKKSGSSPNDSVILESLLFSIDREAADTKQIEDEFSGLYATDIVEPPYNPLLWAALMEKNTRLGKLVRTYAKNTVGKGYKLIPKIPYTKDTSKKEKDEIEEQISILERIFSKPNKKMPFSTLQTLAKIDEESTGNGYVEVARNKLRKIRGLFHIPSHTIRVRRGGLGFIQIRDGNKVFFKPVGADFDINVKTGEKVALGALPPEKTANELIHYLIYSPRSSYYGVPRYTGAALSIAGNQLSGRRNLAFFKNDATPRLIISVANGKLTGDSLTEIKNFVESIGKGPENAGRVMVIQAKPKMVGPDSTQSNVKIDVTPLTVGQTDDASFLKYRKANDEELREAFGINDVFLGGSGINRATSYVGRNITNEQEFLPDIEEKEYYINMNLVETILVEEGIKSEDIKVKFEFIKPKSTDELQEAEIFVRYLQGGGVTPNDIRHKMGLPEFKEPWADEPIQIGLIKYQMGLYGEGKNTEEGGEDPQNQANNENTNGDGTKTPEVDDASANEKYKEIIKMVMKEVTRQLSIQKFMEKVISTDNIDFNDDDSDDSLSSNK